jgi:CrcB protein
VSRDRLAAVGPAARTDNRDQPANGPYQRSGRSVPVPDTNTDRTLGQPAAGSPIDPDQEPAAGSPFAPARPAPARLPWPVLGVISAGGVVGALARYGLGTAFPHAGTGFPWATFGINVSGCLLIGVLMVLIADVWPAHRLLRPFLGTGVLGGYTTFSTYIVDTQHLLAAGAARTALAYLAGTLIAALAAVQTGATLTRLAIRASRHHRDHRTDHQHTRKTTP